jgi:hypothetical protein
MHISPAVSALSIFKTISPIVGVVAGSVPFRTMPEGRQEVKEWFLRGSEGNGANAGVASGVGVGV